MANQEIARVDAASLKAKFIELATGVYAEVVVTRNEFSSFANGGGSVSVEATSTPVLAANVNRKYACIMNLGEESVYLAFGANAVVGKGIRLSPGIGYEINVMNLFTGAVNAIAASSAQSVGIVEA
ncbi:MAG: hypothetical protein PHV74_00175 [Dehalococcoidia bacterium]|nr:hypothetical protein [Dehalococcoidia bacterium]